MFGTSCKLGIWMKVARRYILGLGVPRYHALDDSRQYISHFFFFSVLLYVIDVGMVIHYCKVNVRDNCSVHYRLYTKPLQVHYPSAQAIAMF